MKNEMQHFTMAASYLQDGRAAFGQALEIMKEGHNKLDIVQDLIRISLERFSLALHVYNNYPEWVEDNRFETDLCAMIMQCHRLHGIILYNKELMSIDDGSSYIPAVRNIPYEYQA